MLPGETVHSGAPQNCYECGEFLSFEVLYSPAGYYIGCFCNQHGPHSRETLYYKTRIEAAVDLDLIRAGHTVKMIRT